jgi:hypothetical protein
LDQGPKGGAYSLAIYYQIPFDIGNNMADFMQWSYNGVDNPTADERSDEAEEGGVWTDQDAWISVNENSTMIVLNSNATNMELHGPKNYTVLEGTEEVIVPNQFTVLRGFHLAGSLKDVTASDNSYLQFNPGITLFPTEPPVWLEFQGTLTDDTPNALSFSIEARVNTVGLNQRIELFNYQTNGYVIVKSGTATLSDSIVSVELEKDLLEFVQDGTGNVKARIGWRAAGPVFLFPWTVSIDHVFWTATN